MLPTWGMQAHLTTCACELRAVSKTDVTGLRGLVRW